MWPGLVLMLVRNNRRRTLARSLITGRYLRFPAAAGEPFRQLRGFEKVFLQAGAAADVTFSLADDRWLSMWDEATHGWSLVHGDHDVVSSDKKGVVNDDPAH